MPKPLGDINSFQDANNGQKEARGAGLERVPREPSEGANGTAWRGSVRRSLRHSQVQLRRPCRPRHSVKYDVFLVYPTEKKKAFVQRPFKTFVRGARDDSPPAITRYFPFCGQVCDVSADGRDDDCPGLWIGAGLCGPTLLNLQGKLPLTGS